MTLAEQISQTLAPLIVTIAGLFATQLINVLRKRVQDTRLRGLMRDVEDLIETGVADAHQTIVADAKDPHKPGRWDEYTARDTKLKVIREAKAANPELFTEMIRLGMKQLDSWLCRVLERKVAEHKAMWPTPLQPRVDAPPAAHLTTEGSEP